MNDEIFLFDDLGLSERSIIAEMAGLGHLPCVSYNAISVDIECVLGGCQAHKTLWGWGVGYQPVPLTRCLYADLITHEENEPLYYFTNVATILGHPEDWHS